MFGSPSHTLELGRIESAISRIEGRVTQQLVIIERRRCKGLDTRPSEALLRTFEGLLEVWWQRRAEILRHPSTASSYGRDP